MQVSLFYLSDLYLRSADSNIFNKDIKKPLEGKAKLFRKSRRTKFFEGGIRYDMDTSEINFEAFFLLPFGSCLWRGKCLALGGLFCFAKNLLQNTASSFLLLGEKVFLKDFVSWVGLFVERVRLEERQT